MVREHDDQTCEVTACLLSLSRLVRLAESRWLTAGAASRVLLASMWVGLASLVNRVREDPRLTDYKLHGVSLLSPTVNADFVISAVAALPADAVLQELPDDDRVVLRIDALGQALHDELTYVSAIGRETWARLA